MLPLQHANPTTSSQRVIHNYILQSPQHAVAPDAATPRVRVYVNGPEALSIPLGRASRLVKNPLGSYGLKEPMSPSDE